MNPLKKIKYKKSVKSERILNDMYKKLNELIDWANEHQKEHEKLFPEKKEEECVNQEVDTCDFCRAERPVLRQYLNAKNKPIVGDGFVFIRYCNDCGLAEEIIESSSKPTEEKKEKECTCGQVPEFYPPNPSKCGFCGFKKSSKPTECKQTKPLRNHSEKDVNKAECKHEKLEGLSGDCPDCHQFILRKRKDKATQHAKKIAEWLYERYNKVGTEVIDQKLLANNPSFINFLKELDGR